MPLSHAALLKALMAPKRRRRAPHRSHGMGLPICFPLAHGTGGRMRHRRRPTARMAVKGGRLVIVPHRKRRATTYRTHHRGGGFFGKIWEGIKKYGPTVIKYAAPALLKLAGAGGSMRRRRPAVRRRHHAGGRMHAMMKMLGHGGLLMPGGHGHGGSMIPLRSA